MAKKEPTIEAEIVNLQPVYLVDFEGMKFAVEMSAGYKTKTIRKIFLYEDWQQNKNRAQSMLECKTTSIFYRRASRLLSHLEKQGETWEDTFDPKWTERKYQILVESVREAHALGDDRLDGLTECSCEICSIEI